MEALSLLAASRFTRHVSETRFRTMANSTILYACTEDGLAIVNKPGTSTEWLPARVVLRDKAVASAWAETGPPIRVIAATWEGELLLSENGGRTWLPAQLVESVAALFEMGEPAAVFVALQDGSLLTSTDGGVTWATLTAALPPSVTVTSGELVATGGEAIYLLGRQDDEGVLLRTSAGGGEWRVLPLSGVDAVTLDRATGNLYAMTEGGVQVSDSQGDSWTLMLASPADGNAILAIPAPAGKQPSLVVGTPQGLFLSPEGSTWRPIDLPRPGVVTAFAADPQRRDRLYAATATGYLMESGNRGQSWQPINADPLAAVSYLYVIRI